MKIDDLLELLKSVIEEDAIIGRLYKLFHIEKHYEIATLVSIVKFGIEQGYFMIESIDGFPVSFSDIYWEETNNQHEVVSNDFESLLLDLFSKNPTIPTPFAIFVVE